MNNTIVVKIGTQLLTTPKGEPDLNNLRNLVDQICHEINKRKYHFIIVTSGAITCGSTQMNITAKSIPEKQAAASVGQIMLLQEYFRLFQQHGKKIGQILLTKDVIKNRNSCKNAINTISTLISKNIIPIINENDTVAIDEIEGQRFGDNDELSSIVAKIVNAKHLILLSDIDGIYTAHPNKNKSAKLISKIPKITPNILALADDTEKSNRTKGGMRSKILAAQYASKANIEVIIANGRTENIINKIIAQEKAGTRISPQKGVKK